MLGIFKEFIVRSLKLILGLLALIIVVAVISLITSYTDIGDSTDSLKNALEKEEKKIEKLKIEELTKAKEKETKSKQKSEFKENNINTQPYGADERKYFSCYSQITRAHEARGFHERNPLASIKIKEEVCKAFANGEIDNYEGKK